MRYALPGFMFAALVVGGPLLALANAPAAQGDLLLVVVPPWRDVGAVITTAQGQPVGPAVAPFAGLAVGNRDFPSRALRAGAWKILDGAKVASLCGV